MEEIVSEQITDIQPVAVDAAETQPEAADDEVTSLGRFKSPAELIKAYTNLEKEFTKRSQRLKALEKEVEAKPAAIKEYAKEDWQKRVSDFTEKTPQAAAFKEQIAKEILDGKLDEKPDCLELALARVLLKNYKAPSALAADEEFLEKHVYKNDEIRDRIIKDYLCGINDTRAVKTIGAGGQPVLAAASRPKSIGEAGKLVMEMAGRGK